MAKILAVDDEPAILEMIESILNKDGHLGVPGLAGCCGGNDCFPDEKFANFRGKSVREFHFFRGKERDSDGERGINKSPE